MSNPRLDKARKQALKAKRRPASERAAPSGTLPDWARWTGCPLETLRRNAAAQGYELGPHKSYSPSELYKFLFKAKEYEQTRLTRAQADAEELANKVRAGELMPLDQITKLVAEYWGPPRDFMIGMPATYAARVNPTDPQAGRRGLEEVRDAFLRVAKEVAK